MADDGISRPTHTSRTIMTLRALLPLVLITALTACSTPAKQADTADTTKTAEVKPEATPSNLATGLQAGTYSAKHSIEILGDGDEWVEEEVEDCLWTEPTAEGVRFSFVLVQANGHTCSMDGVAAPEGANTWRYVEPPEEGNDQSCQLIIRADANMVEIEDVNEGCRQVWCGARASIGTTGFSRDTRKDEKTCEP
jgi:hypothetical protein